MFIVLERVARLGNGGENRLPFTEPRAPPAPTLAAPLTPRTTEYREALQTRALEASVASRSGKVWQPCSTKPYGQQAHCKKCRNPSIIIHLWPRKKRRRARRVESNIWRTIRLHVAKMADADHENTAA